MNYYETLYIVHPALEAGRLKDIILGIEESLIKMGGKTLALELWGKRKLSYFIDKQKYGTYILHQYNGEGTCTNDFAVELEHNPNILAYLTTIINEEDVLKIEENLDEQIAGKTRETEPKHNKGDKTAIEKKSNPEQDVSNENAESKSENTSNLEPDASNENSVSDEPNASNESSDSDESDTNNKIADDSAEKIEE